MSFGRVCAGSPFERRTSSTPPVWQKRSRSASDGVRLVNVLISFPLKLILELLRFTILHGLKMLTVKNQFTGHFENLIGNPDHAHFRIARPFFNLSSNRIDGVAYIDRLDKH